MNPQTINITDYRVKSDILAKVIVSFTGNPDRETMREALAKRMDYQAVPVMSSFKQIRPGLAVGFMRANRMVRALSKSELTAKYRVMSSNILMDTEDKSLWDVQESAAGKVLTRHGQEDLTALVHAATQRRPDLPGLRHLAIAKAARSEVVAFVDAEGDVDHGFALATNEETVKVLSFSRRIPVTVDYDSVVSISPVQIPAALHKIVAGSLTADEKKDEKAYYQRLYGYDPAYVREIAKQIDAGTEL